MIASSQVTLLKDNYASWCHANDKTLINGAKIYTGSITADKINVKSLEAICAKIGGFTIGEDALYSGFDEATPNAGVYLCTTYIQLGSKFHAYSDGALFVEEAHATNLNVRDAMTFWGRTDDVAVGEGVTYASVGSISVSTENPGYCWDEDNTQIGSYRCLEFSAMTRFNNAVSGIAMYLDDGLATGGDSTIGGDLSVAGSLSIDAADHTANRIGVVVIGNMCIEFGKVDITTGTTVADDVYTGGTDITFSNTFKYAPAIFTDWAGRYNNLKATGSTGASKTGATIWGKCSDASSTRTIQWIAIGEI